jgi:hypothetical protein
MWCRVNTKQADRIITPFPKPGRKVNEARMESESSEHTLPVKSGAREIRK